MFQTQLIILLTPADVDAGRVSKYAAVIKEHTAVPKTNQLRFKETLVVFKMNLDGSFFFNVYTFYVLDINGIEYVESY